MAERILDPAYLEAFRDELVNRLNFVTELTSKLQSGGELGVEPGFGLLEASQQARADYARAHEETWNNLQKLRQDLYGAVVTLNDALGLHMESEELNVTMLSAPGADIES
ncbi:hypothetical protein GCM10009853_068060 [Glycomyces scopariae]|uniref:Uncharacterized protein n=1 Tax=Glycomyces sambucus TaxID=380244 RepID=A0A1G9GTF0_9ACTN|nr:hypothetical protein [Glycomyces sambucus]SDL03882.1 hypothetical protein SAMN05216298_2412 [Glycomyces sambucus]